VSYTINPLAGADMLPLSAVVILGIKIPFSVDLTSKIAELSADEPSVFMLTLCVKAETLMNVNRSRSFVFISREFNLQI
jgi:hypothetical protein